MATVRGVRSKLALRKLGKRILSSVWKVNARFDRKYKIFEIDLPIIEKFGLGGRSVVKLSRFSPDICDRIVGYWSKEGDTVVDPFMGWGMRGFVARALGRYYTGYEISPSTFDIVSAKLDSIETESNGSMYTILDDGCSLRKTPDESADLIYTCPPYWKVEAYEKVEGQLSGCPNYDAFMKHIQRCTDNCFRVLKKDRFMVWVIADFRVDKEYYDFYPDVIACAKKSGFIHHDSIIRLFRSSPWLDADSQRSLSNRRTQRMHEYVVVFRKGNIREFDDPFTQEEVDALTYSDDPDKLNEFF